MPCTLQLDPEHSERSTVVEQVENELEYGPGKIKDTGPPSDILASVLLDVGRGQLRAPELRGSVRSLEIVIHLYAQKQVRNCSAGSKCAFGSPGRI